MIELCINAAFILAPWLAFTTGGSVCCTCLTTESREQGDFSPRSFRCFADCGFLFSPDSFAVLCLLILTSYLQRRDRSLCLTTYCATGVLAAFVFEYIYLITALILIENKPLHTRCVDWDTLVGILYHRQCSQQMDIVWGKYNMS